MHMEALFPSHADTLKLSAVADEFREILRYGL